MRVHNSLLLWIKVGLAIAIIAAVAGAFSPAPPTRRTGGFGEETCWASGCHASSTPLNGGPGQLTVTGVPQSYRPGEVHRITIVISQAGQSRWGFEMAARFDNQSDPAVHGKQAGSFRIVQGNAGITTDNQIDYVHHRFADSNNRWEIEWTAPMTSSAPVRFDVAANAANGNFSQTGDFIYHKAITTNPQQSFPNSIFFAQFANGQGITSALVLTNPSETMPVTGLVEFFKDNDGTPFPVSIGGNPPSASVAINPPIPPRGSLILMTDGQGQQQAGWAKVSFDNKLGGVVLFAAPGLGIAGVGESQPLAGFITPVRKITAQDLKTGVALANPEDKELVLEASLFDRAGNQVGETKNIPLSARGHFAGFIDEAKLFGLQGDFEGTMVVKVAPGSQATRVLAVALDIGINPAQFTTLPVTPLQP